MAAIAAVVVAIVVLAAALGAVAGLAAALVHFSLALSNYAIDACHYVIGALLRCMMDLPFRFLVGPSSSLFLLLA